MSRENVRAAITVQEEIRSVEEIPPTFESPGIVRVQVGRLDDEGRWVHPQQFEAYVIEHDDYVLLCGDGAGWAEPNKPLNTYRNSDLWHFIDLQRGAK